MLIGRARLKPTSYFNCRLTQRGFTYMAVMVLLAVMLVAMGAVAQVWHTVMLRENEKELLFVGHQFRNAIGSYYKQSGRRFPPTLESLLGSDDAQVKVPRFLRRIYRDPMTNDNKWGVVLGQNGEVVGVHSLSEEPPYKVNGFSLADEGFDKAEKYSDWKFVFDPKKTVGNQAQGNAVSGAVPPSTRIKQ